MKYYLTFVLFGLLMGGLCVVLQVHPSSSPGVAMFSLFSAHEEAMPAGQPHPLDGMPLVADLPA
jgi:hypothetical protein